MESDAGVSVCAYVCMRVCVYACERVCVCGVIGLGHCLSRGRKASPTHPVHKELNQLVWLPPIPSSPPLLPHTHPPPLSDRCGHCKHVVEWVRFPLVRVWHPGAGVYRCVRLHWRKGVTRAVAVCLLACLCVVVVTACHHVCPPHVAMCVPGRVLLSLLL